MSKIALTKRVSITMRGFSILKQYCPGLAQGKAAYELINSIQPFISVWFTAQIVNEISSQRRFNTILLFILGATLLNFICSLLKNNEILPSYTLTSSAAFLLENTLFHTFGLCF